MSDTFENALMWYKDAFLDSAGDMTAQDMHIARYFWDSAVYALEHRLEDIITGIKLMKRGE